MWLVILKNLSPLLCSYLRETRRATPLGITLHLSNQVGFPSLSLKGLRAIVSNQWGILILLFPKSLFKFESSMTLNWSGRTMELFLMKNNSFFVNSRWKTEGGARPWTIGIIQRCIREMRRIPRITLSNIVASKEELYNSVCSTVDGEETDDTEEDVFLSQLFKKLTKRGKNF